MTSKDVIKNTIEMGNMVATAYLSDLSDDDLMVRTSPAANHIAWQLGHLVSSEHKMMGDAGIAMPPLPDGFVESHTKETAGSNDAGKFCKKEAYLAAAATQREATLAALESASDSDLAKATPEEMHAYAKNTGEVLNMIGLHVMMHVGQFAAVRRKLGKPVLF